MTKQFFKLLGVVSIVFIAANAQAQKGSWYIGGKAGYSSQTIEHSGQADIKTRKWSFAPEAGTFLKDNWQLGIGVNLSGHKADNLLDSTTTRFSPVVYLRRFFKMSDHFSTYAGLVVNVTAGSVKAGNLKYDLSGWGTHLTVGAAYALSPRFTAVGQYGLLGYSSETMKIGSLKSKTTDHGFSVNTLGPVLNVGLYWTFKK